MNEIILTTIRQNLKSNSLDAVLFSSSSFITYLTEYAGFSPLEREAYLLVTRENVYLFTDARYIHGISHIPLISLKEISAQTPFTSLLSSIVSHEAIKKVGIEEINLTVAEYKRIKRIATLKPFDTHLLRIIKAENEISLIRKACQIGDATFQHILSIITPGMREKDVALALEQFIKKNDASLSFPSIVAFGKNSAIPHHHTGNQKLKKRDIVLLDFGVRYNNYCSDMTRTIFIGQPTQKQQVVYETVLQAQHKAYKALQKGERNASNIDKIARDYIMSFSFPSLPHALGHGIGLDVHEAPSLSPRSKNTLANGMVFSLEPGIYLPDEFGVRIEDIVGIEQNKITRYTNSNNTLIIV